MGTDLINVPHLYRKSGEPCASCSENIEFLEEVFFLQIAVPQISNGELLLYPLVDTEGGYAYEPFFFEFGCWENEYEEIREATEDLPPIVDHQSKLRCLCCGSGIRELEYVGALLVGELHASQRNPGGKSTPTFRPSGKPEVLCLYCIRVLDESVIDLWEGGISQMGECIDCTLARCWRAGHCTCICHT